MTARRSTPALAAGFLFAAATALQAQTPALPPVTVGAGMQTSFLTNTPSGGNSTSSFALNSIRLYVNGPVTDKIKFTFNTEYDGASNKVGVLDAVAQFGYSDQVNFWVGRFLPPSDRANLYGPYYAHHWAVYTDSIQDGYPTVATGRDNGVAYWGQFGMAKLQVGAFDGASATGKTNVIGAGRFMVDFWDPEPGYYLNGTFYGDKNILAVGVAGQVQDGNTAFSADLLVEKKLPMGGSVSFESEFARYDKLGGWNAQYGLDQGAYGLVGYLFPNMLGMGRVEVLGKYAKAQFSQSAALPNYNQGTTEVDVNYLIKQFNARVMVFFKNTSFSAVQTDFKQFGVGVQLQM